MNHVLLAHGGAHDEAVATSHLYAGYSWSEWLGLAITIVGFITVLALIVRQKRRDRAQ
jgi:hypothetical protein